MIKLKLLNLLFMVGALLQGFGQGLNFIQSSKANADAIYAQQKENEKNRRFNFFLAQKQNEWNLQQWERSNEYNNPLNQMNRLKSAGLNPNLVYGNGAGQSVAVPSPQLTSGSPSTPQDMSLIAQRPTVGQAITQALNNRALLAQIEKTEADTKKTKVDAAKSETDNELAKIELRTKEALEKMFGDVDTLLNDPELMRNPLVQKELNSIRSLELSVQSQTYDNYHKSVDKVIRELNVQLEKQVSQKQWEALSHQFDKSIQECKEFIRDISLRLRGLNADVENKESEAWWNSTDMVKSLPEGLPMIIKILRSITD